MTLHITSTHDRAAHTVVVHVAGDLDYGNTAELHETVTRLVGDDPTLRTMRFDVSALTFCDSAGLAVLLQIHRTTSSADIRLYFDDRPAYLDRILEVTGVLEYLTGPPTGTAFERPTPSIQIGRQEFADASMEGSGKS